MTGADVYATINVETTNPQNAPFPASGTVVVQTTAGLQTVTYTGITATSFTGCTGGTGTMIVGQPVGRSDSQAGLNQGTQNYGQVVARGDGESIARIARSTRGRIAQRGRERAAGSVTKKSEPSDPVAV